MTIEEAKTILINRGFVEINGDQVFDGDKWRNAIAVISKWLEQQPCEDCISRQATVKRLCKVADFMNAKRSGLGSPYITAALFIQDNKDEFPPVTPKEKTGHWIDNTDCSCCGWAMYDDVTESKYYVGFKYCPNCGAKMVSE